jgi:small basic protein
MTFLSAFVYNHVFCAALVISAFYLHISIPFIFLMNLGFRISRSDMYGRNNIKNKFANEIVDQTSCK